MDNLRHLIQELKRKTLFIYVVMRILADLSLLPSLPHHLLSGEPLVDLMEAAGAGLALLAFDARYGYKSNFYKEGVKWLLVPCRDSARRTIGLKSWQTKLVQLFERDLHFIRLLL